MRDTVGNRSSGQRLPLTAPAPEGALTMSSLVVVGRVEPADPKSDPTDPLRLAGRRIVPNLGHPLAAAPGATLLPAPDAAGKITGLSPIPLRKLPPGTYNVKVTVSKENVSAIETTTVTVGS